MGQCVLRFASPGYSLGALSTSGKRYSLFLGRCKSHLGCRYSRRHDGFLPDGRSTNFNGKTQGGSDVDQAFADGD
jgi:hypothetical protein